MSSALMSTAASLRAELAVFDPDVIEGPQCARVAEELAATEKACAAARVLAAARAIACGAHKGRGFHDGPTWVAHQGGVSTGQARQALEAAQALKDCTATKNALLAGEVSWAEASEITRSEAELPGAEEALLGTARERGLGQLKDMARERRLAHTPVEDLHRAQQRARYFRHWRDRLGMVRFVGALPPEVGVPLVHRVELAASRLRRDGPLDQDGRRQAFEACAADALVAMASGEGPRQGPRAELVVVCDINAWRRGHAHPGEACHILDGGPVPVTVARELAKDAFVKAVLHDGVAVHTIKHFSRHLPAELRTALDIGDPPGFSGATCTDCGRRYGLEYDHVDPLANNGPTSLSNLVPRCWADHQAKTERDRQAGLLGPNPPRRRTAKARTDGGPGPTSTGPPARPIPPGPLPAMPPAHALAGIALDHEPRALSGVRDRPARTGRGTRQPSSAQTVPGPSRGPTKGGGGDSPASPDIRAPMSVPDRLRPPSAAAQVPTGRASGHPGANSCANDIPRSGRDG